MKISIIAAVSRNFAIGKNNQLLWHLPNDLKFFMRTTLNHSVVMGRKTYESLGKPLKNRKNIVISSHLPTLNPYDNVLWVNSLLQALQVCKNNREQEVFIIGGGQIYSQALSMAHTLYLTHVDTLIEGDTFFPAFEVNQWKASVLETQSPDEKHNYGFKIVKYERLNS